MLMGVSIPKPVFAIFTQMALRLWLALWVLALPLFHVHTQAENQRGVPHSVFSADLPGEYGPRSGGHGSGMGERQSDDVGRLLSGGSFPELAFTAPVPARDLDFKYQSINAVQKYHGCDLVHVSAIHHKSAGREHNQRDHSLAGDSRGPPHVVSHSRKLTKNSACIGGG